MARKRRGRPIHGWLVLDKPSGITSSKAVGRVKRLLDAAKVGHGGTLDPLATGVLPLAFGEATKTVSYVMDALKTYTFTLRWGEARDTDDSEGAVIETSDLRPDRAAIEAALPLFRGDIEQMPPQYSAIKVEGQRAYDLARRQETVKLAPRQVHIERFELIDMPNADFAVFEVRSGKGTYMRSLARDLARKLGTVGHISDLRRLSVGPFQAEDAISLDNLEKLGHSAPPSDFLMPIEAALDDIPALALTEEEARSLRLGQAVAVLPVARRNSLQDMPKGTVVCAMAAGKLVAMARIQGGEIRPVRVLNV
ncbi:MAG: tRNA pseudouridine(55) synthase TruB [Rhodospirillaceae bacterium]|jgi:tRNA pseudouridine55 synthase